MSRPLTIVLIAYDWHDLPRTSPETVRSKLERDHLRPDYNNIVYVSWGCEAYELVLDEHIKVIHLHARFKHFRPLYDFLLKLRLPGILKKHNISPDVFVAHDLGTVAVLWRARKAFQKPAVLFLSHVPRSLAKTRRNATPRLLYQLFLEKFVACNVDHVFAISRTIGNYTEGLGIPVQNVHYFAPATIPENFKELAEKTKNRVRPQYNIAANKRVVLSVGRLEPEKGFSELLEAFAHAHRDDHVLLIVGDGLERAALEQHAERLGIHGHVRFAGSVPHDELWGYYAASDAFVLLSHTEGLGLVVWEAMVMRVPVLVRRAEGLMESVGAEEERGLLWNTADGLDSFAHKMYDALTPPPSQQHRLDAAEYYVQERISHSTTINDVVT